MDISFIIVNYNTKIITANCIESINSNVTLKKYNYEIIIVDNVSNDGSIEYIHDKGYPNIRSIKNERNEGFGKANNIGVKNAKGNYVVLLNSDTLVQQTNFEKLLDIMNHNDNIGVLSCKVLNENKSIQSLGFKFPSLSNDLKLNLLFWNFNIIKRCRLKDYQNKGLFRVDWISGCFMIMKKDDFESISGFDENIFMYAEDVDLCYRMHKIKKYNYVFDETYIYHLHGKSGNKNNVTLKQLMNNRKNYYYVIKKNKIVNKITLQIIKITYLLQACTLVYTKKIKKVIG